MISSNPVQLLEEVRAAELFRDEHLRVPLELINAYSGTDFRTSRSVASDLENHAYEFLSLVISRIIADNPRVKATPQMPDLADYAAFIQSTLNRWSRDINLASTLLALGYDYAFCFGAAITTPIPLYGYDPSNPHTPFGIRVYRLRPDQFGFDPQACSFREASFVFHQLDTGRTDLMVEASNPDSGWFPDAVRSLGNDSLSASVVSFKPDQRTQYAVDRNTVTYYEVWVPGIKLDESPGEELGFHGTIFTIGYANGGGVHIRKPRPFYGPSCGPYTYFGAFPVPNDPYRMSPLVATAQQNRELNLVARAISRSAEKYKRLIVTDAANQDLMQQIESKPDLFVIGVEDFDNSKFTTAEIGGVTNQLLQQEAIMRDRLRRNSGIDEAKLGQVTGASATEADIADRGGEVRLAFLRQQFNNGVRQILNTAAWYAVLDDRVMLMTGTSTGDNPLIFVGGQGTPELMDMMDIDLEPLSMSRPSESVMQQQAVLKTNLCLQIAQMAASMPVGINYRSILRMLATAYNDPTIENMVDPEAIVAMLQAQQQPAGPQPGDELQTQTQQAPSPNSLPGHQRGAERTAEMRQKRGT